MKKNYMTPDVEIFMFEKKDVVMASAVSTDPEEMTTEHENGYSKFSTLL